jgi:hypothetical protein
MAHKEDEECHQLLQKQEKATLHGCDMQTRQLIWGASDINPKGESLMEYLVLFLIYIMVQTL